MHAKTFTGFASSEMTRMNVVAVVVHGLSIVVLSHFPPPLQNFARRGAAPSCAAMAGNAIVVRVRSRCAPPPRDPALGPEVLRGRSPWHPCPPPRPPPASPPPRRGGAVPSPAPTRRTRPRPPEGGGLGPVALPGRVHFRPHHRRDVAGEGDGGAAVPAPRSPLSNASAAGTACPGEAALDPGGAWGSPASGAGADRPTRSPPPISPSLPSPLRSAGEGTGLSGCRCRRGRRWGR